jgi:hypothetical protein
VAEDRQRDNINWRLRKQADHLYKVSYDKKYAARKELGRLNGWSLSRDAFSIDRIGKTQAHYRYAREPLQQVFDHVSYYRANRRCAAILTEPYRHITLEQARQVVEDFALTFVDVYAPPDILASTHFPGATICLVFAARGLTINWLPDQDGRLKHLWKPREEEELA